MGQILHGSATTTHAIRAAIQRSKAPLKELAAQHGLNHKTVAKWRKRTFVHDAPMGPKDPRSTVLSAEDEAIAVAFRKHTLLPLDDCLYALQATIPHLTRSSLHRCLKRHGISRLPEVAGDKTFKKPFKRRPIGYFHIDIAEVRTGEGKLYLFVAIDRTSKFRLCPAPANGGFSRNVSETTELGECVVVGAVGFERVSESEFPENREKNREFAETSLAGALAERKQRATSATCRQIPVGFEPGICTD